MKTAFVALLALLSIPALAAIPTPDQGQACMKNLPGMITIDPSVAEVNFVKSAGENSFWDFVANGQKEKGYMQHYQNNSCLARVQLYKGDYNRVSEHRAKREARAAMNFRLTRQTRELMAPRLYYMLVEGFEGDLGNISMVGDYRNNFLKIRTTCAMSPALDQQENENAIRTMTVKLAAEVIRSLDGCFKPAK